MKTTYPGLGPDPGIPLGDRVFGAHVIHPDPPPEEHRETDMDTDGKLIIVESPFSGDTERNRRYAIAAMRDCIERGEIPFASHLIYPHVLDDGNPVERALGIAFGERIAEAFRDANYENLVEGDSWPDRAFYIDLGISPGMFAAMKRCAENGEDIEVRVIGGEWAEPAPKPAIPRPAPAPEVLPPEPEAPGSRFALGALTIPPGPLEGDKLLARAYIRALGSPAPLSTVCDVRDYPPMGTTGEAREALEALASEYIRCDVSKMAEAASRLRVRATEILHRRK